MRAADAAAGATFCIARPGLTLVGAAGWDRSLAEACLAAWSRDPTELERVAGSGAVAKLDLRRPMHRRARAVLGLASRSRRAFEVGLHLAARGVRASRPLAFLERRRFGLVVANALVCERAPGWTLREFLLVRAGRAPESGRDEIRRLWKAVAAGVASLHAAGVRQRDLKAPNVIIGEDPAGELRATLIDLDGMADLGADPSPAARSRDLARLRASLLEPAVAAAGVSADDWSAFAGEYIAAWRGRPAGAGELRALVDATTTWAVRKVQRNERRGRVTW